METTPLAVLFDMDGTLLDSEHLWLAAGVEVMESLGSSWTPLDQQRCLGGSLDTVSQYMVERSGTLSDPTTVRQMLLSQVEHLLRSEPLSWRPGAIPFLRATIEAGIPRALVTASWTVLVNALAERMADEIGEDPFTVVVAGDHTTNGKPHPEPYLRAAQLIGVEPHAALAIEDSPTGVRSASTAGCVVVGVPHITAFPADLHDVLAIESLEGWTPASLWRAALDNAR